MHDNLHDNLYEINPPINHLISNVDKQISHLITQSLLSIQSQAKQFKLRDGRTGEIAAIDGCIAVSINGARVRCTTNKLICSLNYN